MKEINGDILPLSFGKRLWYLIINLWRNLLGVFVLFRYGPFVNAFAGENEKRSPGRIYIDSFFESVLPGLIAGEKDISIIEIGCGSGYLRRIFSDIGITGKYLGIDITKHPDFDLYSGQLNMTDHFYKCKIEDFLIDDNEDNFDLVISNTVLEHIKDDKLALENSRKLVKKSGIQIHIVPSGWSLFLYLWHGWRQYPPARIATLFKGDIITLYALGGAFSFFLHFFAVTIPAKIFLNDFVRRFDFYQTLVRNCLKLDKYLPIFPACYVILKEQELTV